MSTFVRRKCGKEKIRQIGEDFGNCKFRRWNQGHGYRKVTERDRNPKTSHSGYNSKPKNLQEKIPQAKQSRSKPPPYSSSLSKKPPQNSQEIQEKSHKPLPSAISTPAFELPKQLPVTIIFAHPASTARCSTSSRSSSWTCFPW